MEIRRSFALELHIFVLWYIELYIRLFSNASKMLGEVKSVIKSDSQCFFFFGISSN